MPAAAKGRLDDAGALRVELAVEVARSWGVQTAKVSSAFDSRSNDQLTEKQTFGADGIFIVACCGGQGPLRLSVFSAASSTRAVVVTLAKEFLLFAYPPNTTEASCPSDARRR